MNKIKITKENITKRIKKQLMKDIKNIDNLTINKKN